MPQVTIVRALDGARFEVDGDDLVQAVEAYRELGRRLPGVQDEIRVVPGSVRRLQPHEVPRPKEGELAFFLDPATELFMTKDHEGTVQMVTPQPAFERTWPVPAVRSRMSRLEVIAIAVLIGAVVSALLRWLGHS